MSYEQVPPAYYQFRQPETPWHAGSKGWSEAPVPIWGTNPNLKSPARLAMHGALGIEKQTLTYIGWAAATGLVAFILWPRAKRAFAPNRRRRRRVGRKA